MDDTWFSRDLPVLDSIVSMVDKILVTGTFPQLSDVADITQIEIMEVGKAAMALENASLIDLQRTMIGGNPAPWFVTRVSGEARQLVGAWPSPQSLATSVYQQLEELAESEGDSPKSSWIKSFVNGASTIGKDVVVEVLATAIGKTLRS